MLKTLLSASFNRLATELACKKDYSRAEYQFWLDFNPQYTSRGEREKIYLKKRLNEGGSNDVFVADYWSINKHTNKASEKKEIVVKFGKPYVPAGEGKLHLLNMVMSAFSDEVRINNLISSTNIEGVVRPLGGGNAGKIPYLKMEYIKGISLDETYKTDISEEERLIRIAKMAYLANTISQLHYYEIIHKDLKPRNLLLCTDKNHKNHFKILICDFGFSNSKLRDANNEGGGLITPVYAAPEQILMGTDLGPSVDYFSFGVVLHEYLTGYSLFPNAANIFIEDKQVITDRYMNYLKNGRENRLTDCSEMSKLVDDLTTYDSFERMHKCKNLFDIAHRLREFVNDRNYRDVNTDFLWNQLNEYQGR